MIENFRRFEAGPDPFGKTWEVSFVWLQTAISIRHSDSVDVKFFLSDGETNLEKVVALMAPHLLALSAKTNHPLTDPWCMKLAALHIRHMIETAEDFEKTLVTVSPDELDRYAAILSRDREEAVSAGTRD
jgi:hypothetical protein